ncbi:MAG: FMN-binding negative transcriptional regulator [Kiloniellales bacterium]|nr:FMN-binding negative transcriptional regulator [Kiloniellales bacterium]
MYVPQVFALDDKAEIDRIIRQFSFGLLVTAPGGAPQATHLPFLWDAAAGPKGTLLGHMARANAHWRDFARLAAAEQEALVVFQGEHGYVSPNWYQPGPAVPTWNYLAVHLYGRPRLVEAPAEMRAMMVRLADGYEQGFETPWTLDSQPADYEARMMRGIVAFEIPVTRVEAKAKLSQNRPAEDRTAVIAALEASGRAGDRELGGVMRKILA